MSQFCVRDVKGNCPQARGLGLNLLCRCTTASPAAIRIAPGWTAITFVGVIAPDPEIATGMIGTPASFATRISA